MGSVNISIKKEAYRFLKSLKRGDKSFSDIILEFKGGRRHGGGTKSILRFWGVLEGSNWKEKEEEMKNFRKEVEERLK